MARVRALARPEMAHENPLIAPLLVAMLRQFAETMRAQEQRNGDVMLLAGPGVTAMASIIETWASQITDLHKPPVLFEGD